MQSDSILKNRFSIVRPLVIITAAVVLVGWAISQIGSGDYAKSNPYLEDVLSEPSSRS
ncbi:hypothetical protein [Marivita cryptomonadis]|uniref:Uncharacterized protein n=1 Tax=Marivita cryptomonadis TaxID=505252 RepID=A0ABS1ZY82_9RHOB|nr:hypothetical protein [Marivita cryptomonadis]MBM2332440.1 hypothetical protein [Marivita cryptomonadis]MBM2346838.1 hypothetical protein [Marivita cryptomonadis]MBM2351515.1 hypothetical protein [Marivita cryptomonadis]MBM2375369.1 hypothetical protein [Marivita cryptomonadis]MBM2418630.1 hypothetical protein [Marivita cryptomonadis]